MRHRHTECARGCRFCYLRAFSGGSSLCSSRPHPLERPVLTSTLRFTCAGDGAPIDPHHHGWLHWFDQPIPNGGSPKFDLFPDVSDYTAEELQPAPGLTLPDGKPAKLFSSRNPRTVQRHFQWMADHGIDGAFFQRFATEVKDNGGLKALKDEICDRVHEAADQTGRVWAVMWVSCKPWFHLT
jgi:hypothetical protein